MKKMIAFLCAVFMIVSLCGCGKEETTSVVTWEEESGQTDADISSDGTPSGDTVSDGDSSGNDPAANTGSNSSISDPLAVDLKGATVSVYQTGYSFTVESKSSKTDIAKNNMIEKLQKELNCKLKVTTVDEEKLKTLATTSAASGKALCGIISPTMYSSGYYIGSNLVANLKKVSSIDLTKDYMKRYHVIDATRFGNGLYAVPSQGKERTSLVFFNKRILKEMGYEDAYIYDLVDSGKWTYDVFRDLAKKAMKDLDGKPGFTTEDQWGVMLQDGHTKTASDILASFGTSLIKLDSSGQLVYNMTDQKVTRALELGKKLMLDDGTAYVANSWEERIKFFAAGKSLFLYADVGHADMLQSMKDEFGVAPTPQVSASKNYVSVMDYNCRVLMIPAGLSAKDQYNSGAVVQAYEYLLDDVYSAMDKEYANRYFSDKKAVENWQKAEKAMTSLPEQVYKNTNETINAGTYRILWDLFQNKISSPTASIEKNKVAVQKALDDLNRKIRDK